MCSADAQIGYVELTYVQVAGVGCADKQIMCVSVHVLDVSNAGAQIVAYALVRGG